jgi:hypothetical protein
MADSLPRARTGGRDHSWRWQVAAIVLCGIVGVVPLMQAIDVLGVPRPAPPALRAQLVMTVGWIVVARRVAARWSLADSEVRALAGLAALAFGTTGTAAAVLGWWLRAQLTISPFGSWLELLLALLPIHALTLGLISLVGSWTNARRLESRAANREAVLQASLVRAELEALRTKLQPHFLFNTLNTVVALARDARGERAADVAADLGELLRFSLAESSDAVPFDAEREIVERYCAIEQARLGERLRLTWALDPAARTATLPAMIWQPLVENAVRHGIARRSAPGMLALGAHVAGGQLTLMIDADAPEVPAIDAAAGDGGLGIGLAATQRRLALLYGERAQLTLTVEPGRSRTVLTLPLHLTTPPHD